jgi:molybdopterin synthase sulfur carrier subunit
MAKVILTGSIRQRAGGLGAVEVGGATVKAAIDALEQAHPALRGWVLDEQGAVRRHIKLFLRGTAVALDAPIGADEELYVVAAISGG